MAKISLSYPDTWLTISISVKNRDTWVEVFSDTMTEVGTTKVYTYDFTEVVNTDYIYVATVSGYSDMSWVIYRDGWWLTTEQVTQLTRIYTYVDTPVSEIAVGWNPYANWINWLKKWIQRIVDKVEEKWEEVKTKIESEVKTIVIPEQKEPIVNITTENIDTANFIKEIKKIKPEVTVTTEKVDIVPVLDAIKWVWKISDIKFPDMPEHKEPDFTPIIDKITEVYDKIDSIPDNSEKINKIEEYVDMEMEEKRMEEQNREEDDMMDRPLPSSFTAVLK